MTLIVRSNNFAAVAAAFSRLRSKQVLVGVPATDADRESGDPMNNAQLAYLHDKGSPANNIPARPFMQPGMQSGKQAIVSQLEGAAQAAIRGDPDGVDRRLNAAGTAAQSAIRRYINTGIAPVLSEWTLMQRARRGRKGAAQELKNRREGKPASLTLAKPLIDTGQLRNSITYVIRVR